MLLVSWPEGYCHHSQLQRNQTRDACNRNHDRYIVKCLSFILEIKKLQGAVEAKMNADLRAKNGAEKQFPIPNVM